MLKGNNPPHPTTFLTVYNLFSLSVLVDSRRSQSQLPTSPALQLASQSRQDDSNALWGVQLPFLIGNNTNFPSHLTRDLLFQVTPELWI